MTLPGIHSAQGAILNPGSSLVEVVGGLGLLSGLKLCLDAGDINSYDGISQVWNDVSGGGYNFNLGVTSSVEGSDPTFHGTAGAQTVSEYFSVDGADSFTLGQSNPTWMQNLHKAGMKFGVAAWIYRPTPGSVDQVYFATKNTGTEVGFSFFANDDTNHAILTTVGNGSAEILQIGITSASLNTSAWNFVAISYDAGASIANAAWIGSSSGSASASLSLTGTPSASSAAQTARIANSQNGSFPSLNGTRFKHLAIWEGVTPAHTDLLAIGTATRGKFGV